MLAIPATLIAAEVINLKVGQSGDKGFATFDLSGKIGDREAEVFVTLTINGEKYTADKLTLTGDLGKKVKIGVGRRIVWDILADIPNGFDGEVVWDVDTSSSLTAATGTEPRRSSLPQSSSNSPFEFGELAARDKNTGLLWLREASKDGKGKSPFDARTVTYKLATEKFAGCSDWKLPDADQVTKIVDYALEAGYTGKMGKGYPADYFNAIGFKGVSNDYYWIYDLRSSWNKMAIDLEDGNTMERSNKDYLQIWPVCKPN
jgi:Protein of unknown function (DUF1566)